MAERGAHDEANSQSHANQVASREVFDIIILFSGTVPVYYMDFGTRLARRMEVWRRAIYVICFINGGGASLRER